MKKNKINTMKGLLLAAGMLIAFACTNGLENNLNNPSALSPEQASNEFLWNGIQLNFVGYFLTATDFGMDNTRMRNLFGSNYENAYTANAFNGLWTGAYSDVMVNANLLLKKTTEDAATTEIEYNPFYQGTTKVMKAYILMTLVDYFGKVPYAEAFDAANFNPAAQDDKAVYDSAKVLLDAAIVDLTAVVGATPRPAQDMYYAGNALKWRKAANTMLFKWHLNRRLIDATGSQTAMAALIAANDMITSAADDFNPLFPANSQSNPNTYHPWFFGNYLTSTGPYMSNSYMKELYDAKGIKDPRIRYYFYRQVNTENTNVNNLTCSTPTFPYTAFPPAHYPPGTAYCQLPEGYWGRDHLNFEGTPPDGLLKTTFGLYPAGGRFDANYAKPVTSETTAGAGDGGLSAGARGKGICPILQSAFTQFMIAEYELMLNGNAANARAALNTAVRASIAKSMNFNPAVVSVSFVPSATGINNYVNVVLARYDGAPIAPNLTVQENQLDIISKEYWVALWGNGIESYNMYRRNGKPSMMQPALALNPGNFYRTFSYPGVYVIRNHNAAPKLFPDGTSDNTVQVFWDNNPAGFIK